MTTLENRPNTALLVVDMQTGVVAAAHERQVITYTNVYWTYQTAPGRTAGTIETEDVDFGTDS